MFQSKTNATFIGLVAYLLLVLAMPVGKLVGVPHLASFTWAKASFPLWGPWLLAGSCWLLLGVVRLGEKLAKTKVQNDLTVPRS